MSASTPSLKAQFEEQYTHPEPSINEGAACCSCDDYSCNDELQ